MYVFGCKLICIYSHHDIIPSSLHFRYILFLTRKGSTVVPSFTPAKLFFTPAEGPQSGGCEKTKKTPPRNSPRNNSLPSTPLIHSRTTLLMNQIIYGYPSMDMHVPIWISGFWHRLLDSSAGF